MPDFDILLSHLFESATDPDFMQWASREGLRHFAPGGEQFVGALEYIDPPMAAPAGQSPLSAAVQDLVRGADEQRQAAAEEEAARPTREAQERAERQREANLRSLKGLTTPGEQLSGRQLLKIRAEAKAKGRAGSLGADVQPTEEDYIKAAWGPGGSFSQQAPSPELDARLADRDRWLADQPMREQEFLASAEQARRNPALAQSAAQRLTEMREQRAQQQERDIQMSFVEKLAGSGGTIPADQAAQLQAIGVHVPSSAIGATRQEAVGFFDDAIRKGGQFLADRGPEYAGMQDPMTEIQKWGMLRADHYRQLVEAGQMNPDDAVSAWRQEVAQRSMAVGILSEQGQLMSGPTQVGE
jgi:hypothetical protein